MDNNDYVSIRILLLIIILVVSATSQAQIKIPGDYQLLSESPANGRKIDMKSFRFDNDSENDTAILIKHKTEFSKYKLLLYLSTLRNQLLIDLVNTTDFTIYPIQLAVNKNVLTFGYFEDGTAAFGRFIKLRFDASNKKIQIIGYDSGYRSSASDYTDKSFNLLTGKYVVKKTKYSPNEKKTVEEFSGKNDFFKQTYTNQLNIELLKLLDDVGSKYE